MGFLLLPLYTRAIDPAQYGTLALLISVSAAVAIVFTLGLDLAIFRTFFELSREPSRQREFVNSVWRFLVCFPLVGAVAIGAVAWPIIGSGERVTGLDLLLALVGAALYVAATTVPLAVLRAQQRLRDYIAVTGVTALANAGLTVLFVVVLDGGVRGWLLATVAANVIALLAAAVIVPWRRAVPYRSAGVRRSIRLGLPLVPHFLSHWALQLADRIVLAGIVSAGALGVYSLAANLALPVMILVQALNQGFMPTYARAGTESGHEENLANVVTMQATLVTLVCAGGALLAPPFVSILVPASYAGAGTLISWLVLGYGFLGLYYIPMNGASLGAGRTRFVATATLLAAATNIGLLFWLVPSGGLKFAAIASAGGYAVLLVGIFIYSRKPGNPVRYRWRTLAGIFALGGASFAGGTITTPSTGLRGLIPRGLWILALGVALLFVHKEARATMRAWSRSARQAIRFKAPRAGAG